MDLEGLYDVDLGIDNDAKAVVSSVTAAEALKWLDENWYTTRVVRGGRWMDLIGDYAGSENFIIDGESLLQVVLDDPLLALARQDCADFQILHAIYIMECILNSFRTRSAVFEVVFWEETRHTTLQTGESPSVTTARSLARQILFNHLLALDLQVYAFLGATDPAWIRHQNTTKPMFIMVNDGGVDAGQSLSTERILIQRIFLMEMTSSGLPLSLLKGAEFRGSKILSFVYEARVSTTEKNLHFAQIESAVSVARTRLDALEATNRHSCPLPPPLSASAKAETSPAGFEDWLTRTSTTFSSLRVLSTTDVTLFFIFLVHSIILEDVSVEERAQPPTALHPSLSSYISETFLPLVFLAVKSAISCTGIVPPIDGRVFTSLIHCLMSNVDKPVETVVGEKAYQMALDIWTSCSDAKSDVFRLVTLYALPETSTELRTFVMRPFKLLPFSNEVFDKELSSIALSTEDRESQISPPSRGRLEFGHGIGICFTDTQHWHNTKRAILPHHLGGEDKTHLEEWQKRKLLKSNQRFTTTLRRQAETLTSHAGSILEPIVIAAGGTSTLPKRNPPTRQNHKKANNAKGNHLSSKEKLLKEISASKQATHENALLKFWKNQLDAMQKMSIIEQIVHLQALERNKDTNDPFLAAEFGLYKVHVQLSLWIDDPNRDSGATRDRQTVIIIRQVKGITDRKCVTATVSAVLVSVLGCLGFADYALSMTATSGDIPDRPLGFKFRKLFKSKGREPIYEFMRITEHPVQWQLRLFGEYMDRSMDSQQDERVVFEPDAWQVQVLDAIDRGDSLLAVAPTSAGKTFISFYAMEKVLRESDDGILVYVAPTKPLVSQIAAEVYARFRKNLDGKSLWAIHTRDYRVHDPLQCQILVTVPEMLEIMLLSPPMARFWTPRIRRIILDEIHCIGQQEGGTVWEHIILLSPCPIIGLSATIGSPDTFNKWLHSVQTAHGFNHTFISHPYRYSHLRKFYYALQYKPTNPFSGLDTYKSTDRAVFLHPISMLSFGPRSLPSDLALEASDTLSLYTALSSHKEKIYDDLSSLEPSKFFPDPFFLCQKDIIRYESALKSIILRLANQESASTLAAVIRELQDKRLAQIHPHALNAVPSKSSFRSNLIHLVSDLHLNDNLPAILFNFDRTECEIMATDLVEALQDAEQEWRRTSPKWKQKLRQYDEWIRRSKDRHRQAEQLKRQKPNADEPLPVSDSSWQNSFDPDDPLPQFSFAGDRRTYSKSDMEEEIQGLIRWSSMPKWAGDALRRGIAVHHSGMNKRYRSLVESLFRLRFVRVIIATGTLALGINAPTKTVVFCGDSPYLTALMYRQCSGRAGRRGFDTIGHVVFYGLSLDRIERLCLSKLPSITGNFPLTSTLSLRLFNLLDGSDNAPVSVKAIQSIMNLPQISIASEAGRDQVLHHLRFSIDYLRRAGLLDHQGKPLNLFGVVGHLYYHEPSNLALVVLLRNGVLHEIASQASTIQAQREFILLMAHLFGRRYISKHMSLENLRTIARGSSSMVILPPLQEDARQVLLDHELEILRVFTSYALQFATHYATRLGRDCCLPFSGQNFGGQPSEGNAIFREHLRHTAIRGIARSPFVANSGHDDHFTSIPELTRTARNGLHLSEHAIPSMIHITGNPNSNDSPFSLNAYLLDFFIHGQPSALSKANGIRRGDVWYALQDFVLSLKTIRATIQQLLLKASHEATGNGGHHGDTEDLGTYDPSESDSEGDGAHLPTLKQSSLAEVSDLDWKVYTMINEATEEFDRKFRAMWA